MSWRGHTLIINPSHLRVKAVTLSCPVTLKTLHSHNSRAEAIGYCRRNGYSWMDRKQAGADDMATLEQRI